MLRGKPNEKAVEGFKGGCLVVGSVKKSPLGCRILYRKIFSVKYTPVLELETRVTRCAADLPQKAPNVNA